MKITIGDKEFRDNYSVLSAIVEWFAKRIFRQNLGVYPQLAVFSFDYLGTCINFRGRYENSTLLLIGEHLDKILPNSKQLACMDIGANIGNHSIFFARYFDRVFAFEPNPITADILAVNAAHFAPFENVEVFKFGLSNTPGVVGMRTSGSNSGAASIGKTRSAPADLDQVGGGRIHVRVECLDEISKEWDFEIGLIKIDVEGHELQALEGAQNLIEKNQPVILFEQQAAEIIDGSSEVIEFLRRLGYEFSVVERRFTASETTLGRMYSLLMRTIFGDKIEFRKIDRFPTKYYELILATKV